MTMARNKSLAELAHAAYEEKRRLVAPLVGFPGLRLTGGSIKLAQQNYGEHYQVIKALAERYEPDLIFPLMDLAVEANAMGRYTVFPTDDSATVVKDTFDLTQLQERQINIAFDTRLLGYVETLKLMSIGLPPKILRGAYVTGPYSLAALMMGADEAAMATIMAPETLTTLCELCTTTVQDYIRLLSAGGAQVICILEPSAVMLGPDQFYEFSAQYVSHITESCKYGGLSTIYHTCGNTMHLIEAMANAGVDAISLDSVDAGVDLAEAARRTPEETAIIGNINPTGLLLNGQIHEVAAETQALLQEMDPFPHFILSTGCDLPQETPFENIDAFVQSGREHIVRD